MTEPRSPRELGLKLGRRTDEVSLDPIPREMGRRALGQIPRFTGFDGWNAYEASFLLPSGKPVVFHLRVDYAADTPFMVESKSFKLYLNHKNNEIYTGIEAYTESVVRDISLVCGGPVRATTFTREQSPVSEPLPGTCLDNLEYRVEAGVSGADLLETADGPDAFCFHSHLLRSLCPVTRQPDWGAVLVRGEGGHAPRPESLLAYIVSFRDHEGFHETCCERMFADIYRVSAPRRLEVACYYTRRGGLDINPVRTLGFEPLWRPPVWRQ
jgi:7-cyano-7-deazaguanine reductase